MRWVSSRFFTAAPRFCEASLISPDRRSSMVFSERPRAVLRTALAAILDALGVERAADDVVAHAGQILDAAAADQHHRVLLQVMAFAGDVARHLEPVGETDAGDLAQRRVRLLRRRRIDAGADAALLRARLQGPHLVARHLRSPRAADKLVDPRHPSNTPSVKQMPAKRQRPRYDTVSPARIDLADLPVFNAPSRTVPCHN